MALIMNVSLLICIFRCGLLQVFFPKKMVFFCGGGGDGNSDCIMDNG